MSRHWNPDHHRQRSGSRRPAVPRSQSTRWLTPEEYRSLSPQQKRRLYVEREEERRGYQFGERTKAAVLLSVMVGTAWVSVFGMPRIIQQRIHPPSPPVSAIFGSCKWGGGTNCVVDGDTFWIGGQDVRIANIDAPETHDYDCQSELALGDEAATELQALLNSGAVTMTSIDRDTDTYGRLLRNVAVNGRDVGQTLVADGLARPWEGHRQPWC